MSKHKKKRDKSIQKEISVPSSSRVFYLILSCFFVSGLTGLTYEILWTRMIVKIIGSAPFAVSMVLTVFMGGLGLGSYIAGRKIDRIKDPLQLIRLYGILEIAIGAYGIILPLLLVLFRPAYAVIYNKLFQHFLGYNLITFAGCFILLIVPVMCMGATLPVLSRFFITTIDKVGTNLGRLYGLNTIGAAAGAVLCGFWMINTLGVWGTLFFAIGLNAIIGIICIMVGSRRSGREKRPPVVTEATIKSDKMAASETIYDQSHIRSALVVFFISGFCAMAYEVIWTKLLGLIVGPTTYSFTIVLVTFITGLALGSLFFGWLGDRIKNVALLLLFTQIAAALSALLMSQIMGNSQLFFAKLIYHFKDNFAQLSLVKGLVLFLFMFLPTIFLGAAFPLVGKIYTRSLSRTGRSIGYAYAVNSLGAVLGSFCAGFVLVPLIGKEQGLGLVVGIQLLTALIIGSVLFRRKKTLFLRWTPLGVAALGGICFAFPYPHWDRKMISVGQYHRAEIPSVVGAGWMKTLFRGEALFADLYAGKLLFFGDGIGGFTTVIKNNIDILGNMNLVMYNSGKPDASSRLDMDTQTLSAHFPMLFHPDPKNVLVVGLASGITAGEILHYPIDRLDVVEISNEVVEASDFFTPWNSNVLSDPRTELIIQDARAHLELTNRRYDVISSEPSNPWMAGLANLFTREFFSLARERLNENGIYVQFIHTYQMDWATFAMIGRTFSSVFPNGILVRTNPSSVGPDFLLVGFKGDGRLDERIPAQNLIHAQSSKNVTLFNHRLFYLLIITEDLERLFGKGLVNSDRWPRLEFLAPKLMHTLDLTIVRQLIDKHWLSRETLKIVDESFSDVDKQIDLAAYALPFFKPNMPFQFPVDLSQGTPTQRERFLMLIKNYCASNIVKDYSLLDDEEIKDGCLSAQITTVLDKLDKTDASEDKEPLILHLRHLYSEREK